MPTLLLLNGFRFFFYSNENNEPIRVHVSKGNANCKIWLEPSLTIAYVHGFTRNEEKEILQILIEHCEQFKMKWNEYFNK